MSNDILQNSIATMECENKTMSSQNEAYPVNHCHDMRPGVNNGQNIRELLSKQAWQNN